MRKPKACSPKRPTQQAWVGGTHRPLCPLIKGFICHLAPGSTDPCTSATTSPTWGHFGGKASVAQFFPPRCFPGSHPRVPLFCFPSGVGEAEIPCASVRTVRGRLARMHGEEGSPLLLSQNSMHMGGESLWGRGCRESRHVRASEIEHGCAYADPVNF